MKDYSEVVETTRSVPAWKDSEGKLHDTKAQANLRQAIINGDARKCVDCEGTTRILGDDDRTTYTCQSCDSNGLQYPTWGSSKQ